MNIMKAIILNQKYRYGSVELACNLLIRKQKWRNKTQNLLGMRILG